DAEERAKQAVARIEDVVDEAIDLDVLGQPVPCADVDAGVAADLLQKVGLITKVILARRRDEVRTHLPSVGDPVIEAELETIVRNARDVVAGLDVDAGDVRVPRAGHAERMSRRLELVGCLEGRADVAVARVERENAV